MVEEISNNKVPAEVNLNNNEENINIDSTSTTAEEENKPNISSAGVELPHWIKETEQEGTYSATIRKKEYVMKELPGRVMNNVRRLAENTNQDYDILLVSKSLVKPEMAESDIQDLPGGVLVQLQLMTKFVYGLDAFLE